MRLEGAGITRRQDGPMLGSQLLPSQPDPTTCSFPHSLTPQPAPSLTAVRNPSASLSLTAQPHNLLLPSQLEPTSNPFPPSTAQPLKLPFPS